MVQSFGEYSKTDALLHKKWTSFNEGKSLVTDGGNDFIIDSWKRCKSLNTKLKSAYAPTLYTDAQIKEHQVKNQFLIDMAMPHLKNLYQTLDGINPFVTLSDHKGTVLKLLQPKNSKVADQINLLPGASWEESYCGTNGIGTALVENKSISVFGYEHFCENWHNLICTAVPLNDPLMGNQLGVINVSGDKRSVFLHNTALIKMVGNLIETTMYEHLMFDESSGYRELLNGKSPVVLFNPNYVIKHVNKYAMRELGFVSGERLQLFPPNELSSFSHHPIQSQFEDSRGRKWNVNTTPYIVMGRMMGRLASFEKITESPVMDLPKKAIPSGLSAVITQNTQIQNLKRKAEQIAKNDHSVLIYGETGTGKELFAKAIHLHSNRSHEAFVTVNCGALPKDLIASELFGYVKGAFTNANASGKKGKFEQANKGTLFLDEIGELPIASQTYLLRILEEQMVYPLGSEKGVPINVRIVAATNRDLSLAVKHKTFRSDLLYRLKIMELNIPPLRSRKGDITFLFNHFIKDKASFISGVEKETLSLLQVYDWPGNVRELKNNCLKTAFNAQFRGDTIIKAEDLPRELHSDAVLFNTKNSDESSDELTKEVLELALQKVKWNKSKAAKLLEVSRTTVYRKINEFGL
ncbi:sigma-54-dependent Fis family transcriptional regulator [Maribacter sp. 2210JD10-5]|uniref:sigma-54-dependent Fis family transcriptional regulator n=1 Tax=Maribacter sp. 2210JD10-5 TaxID=3386272 RepID=UPI0039BD2052